jgi:hypothetical protein
MRRLLLGALLLATGLNTGCIKMHVDTIIEKDGSGTCTITYSISHEVAEAFASIEQSGAGMGMDSSPPQLQDLTRSQAEAASREAGVKLLDHRLVDQDGVMTLTMELGFDDIARLSGALDALLGDDAIEDEPEMLGIFAGDDGNFVLKTVPVAREPRVEDVEDDQFEMPTPGDMASMQAAMQHMETLMAHLDQMDMRLSFTVPGEVIHSNAMEVEDRTSIWTVNAANMMQSEEMDMSPEIRFAGKGLTLKPTQP